MNEPTIDWKAHIRVAIEDVRDRYAPMSGWLGGIQLGLRSDGVLVWRRVDADDNPIDEPATER